MTDPEGTQESMMQSTRTSRAGGHGGPAPVRRFLPELIELIRHRTIDLEQAAEGHRGVDERRAIKALLRP